MEDFDKIRVIGRCTNVINLLDVADAMLNECCFDRNGKKIVSEETDRIMKIEMGLKEIYKEIEMLKRTI
jgi:hypothetical protein